MGFFSFFHTMSDIVHSGHLQESTLIWNIKQQILEEVWSLLWPKYDKKINKDEEINLNELVYND